jgi:hypothetical protein
VADQSWASVVARLGIPDSLCLTTVSYAARTCGRGRRPRNDGNTHVGVGMSDALGRLSPFTRLEPRIAISQRVFHAG